MEHPASRKYIVISADCHAGPRRPADYRPYVDPGYRNEFDDYVQREEQATRNMFGAEIPATSAVGDEALRARLTRSGCIFAGLRTNLKD